MIKVLSIGNSFSQDAQKYLHGVAKSEGENIKCVNLFIGSCSLYTHYSHIIDDKASYSLDFNGESTGFYVSIKEALISDEWNYVTLQQVSHLAPDYETYLPYIQKLSEYVRTYSPKTKILLHQTWAYEQDSKKLCEEVGFSDQHDMLSKIVEAYKCAAKDIAADGIIPCGIAMMNAIDRGIGKIHRDTLHASYGVGRYILALTWYTTLTKKIAQNTFSDFDENVSEEQIKIAKSAVIEAVKDMGIIQRC